MRVLLICIVVMQSQSALGQGRIPISQLGPMQSNTLALHIPPILATQDRIKLWDALASTAQPTNLLVPAGQNPSSAVRARCGDAPADLIRKLAALNPGMFDSSAGEDRNLRFIPCPYWNFGVRGANGTLLKAPTVPVRKGEAIEPILKQYTGASSAESLAALVRANRAIIDATAGRIRNDGLLLLPTVVRPTIVTLTETQTRETAAASIQPIADSLPVKVRQALRVALSPDEYQLVASDDPSLTDPVGECGGPLSAGDWPFDVQQLREAFDATIALTPALLLGNKPNNVVGIADTGVLASDIAVTARLWDNLALAGGVVDPTTRFKLDPHGASMVTMKGDAADIEPASDYPFARHGTDVARVLVEPGTRDGGLDKRFGIAVMKLNAQTAPFGIHVNTVPTALNYARRIKASVVNLSVVTGATSDILEDAIGASTALIVAAAGNNRDAPESIGVFPPALPSHREKLIVVGAHDWNKKLTAFSNFGKSVDILAPGCAIPLIDKAGGLPRYVSGTSFAAPFVTYTASMLRALSFSESPAVVRARILASGRFVPELVNITGYGVILDIPRAVRFREDSYLPKGSGTPVYGTVDPVQNFLCELAPGKSKSVRPRDVLKVLPNYRSQTVVPMVWTQLTAEGPFLQTLCQTPFTTATFRFKPTIEADFKDIRWSDVDDLVMRSTIN